LSSIHLTRTCSQSFLAHAMVPKCIVLCLHLAVLPWDSVGGVRLEMDFQGATLEEGDKGEMLVAKLDDSKPRESNYWHEAQVMKRCRRAKLIRFAKRTVGIVMGMVMTAPIAAVSLISAYVAAMDLGDTGGLSYRTMWVANSMLVPVALSAQPIAESVVENLQKLLGANGHHPACCCNDGFCALVGSKQIGGNRIQANCPDSWEHDATQCAAPEMLTYLNETVSGCACKEGLSGCAGNKLYRGHTWCEVEESEEIVDCGSKYKRLKKRRQGARWDYCRFAEHGVLEDGTVVANSSAVAAFVPNLRRRLFASTPWMPKTDWLDEKEGLAIKRPALFRRPQCFAGTPVETLDGCAQKCLQEGAPAFKRAINPIRRRVQHGCVAMAYNRETRLCVRLPFFARNVVFNPPLKSFVSKGWQNFILSSV